ncbi:hypothetical protein PGT21_032150 [Puccinia graminis f. sp. tritici]|uniref:Uncharacterized protein n=1 Tax=Puccinia graminis f. sp. tritici TaxID=56615 RepID=A0A5B0M7Z6_PUCGR|nr:hypothetical protein PGT21_032150 [Puccinia graminis f. sp. tritici]
MSLSSFPILFIELSPVDCHRPPLEDFDLFPNLSSSSSTCHSKYTPIIHISLISPRSTHPTAVSGYYFCQ